LKPFLISAIILIATKEENMLNQIVLVGRVIQLPEIRETPSGAKVATLHLEVDRNFRNSHGEYEKDNFSVTLWRGVAETTISVCEVGSLVGIKGRIQANTFETKDQKQFHTCEVIAEKVSFLQTKS
jgi:single-strand DNA-binding protein